MKAKLNRILRLVLILTVILLAAGLAFLIYREKTKHAVREQKVSVYSYSQKAGVGYQAVLRPNPLSAQAADFPADTFISEYLDSLLTRFDYQFSGERNADISGSYEVSALMEGYNSLEGKSQTIWQKQFVLVPKTGFNTTGKKFSVQKPVLIKYRDYNAYAKAVIKSSMVTSLVRLTVTMNLNLTAHTDKGLITEKAAPVLSIPLNTPYFTIIKSRTAEKLDFLQTTQKLRVPVNQRLLIIYGSLIGILAVSLLYLIFFTVGIDGCQDPAFKSVQKIFRQHGDRLVALQCAGELSEAKLFKVWSIDDLVRVADEIEKPIMYQYSPEISEITRFYIIEGDCVYLLDLQENSKILEKGGQTREAKS